MADKLSMTFAALADPTRRAVLARLALGEASVAELARPFKMTVRAVSKHVSVLEKAGLVARAGTRSGGRAGSAWHRFARWTTGWSATAACGKAASTTSRRCSTRSSEGRSMTLANDRADAWAAEFTLTRVLKAPRALVYRIWTDPKYVALWWGIAGATNPVCELDVRPGGRWRIDMRTASGTVYRNSGVYLEVIENRRLVSTDVSDPSSPAWKGREAPADRLNTVTFEDAGEGTRVTIRVQFKSVADHDFFVGAGVKQGIGESLDRLERVLARL